ncbi:helix-turn-helix domain-containing protein [Streptomyces sp. 4N509B]|uniref:helix-turn-helix domain-containing protein n=1 Tax=Streptomyces sp. 4N509B TaxID=3457413 RepID=UPI003FCF16AB
MPPLPPDRILRRRLEVGRRIRDARTWANLTQERLAERAEIDRKTISRIENGHMSPSLDHLLDIAEAAGVEPVCLVPGGPEPWGRPTAPEVP